MLVYAKQFTKKDFSDVSVKVFSPFYNWPVFHIHAPSTEQMYWAAFCFYPQDGLKGIKPVNKVVGHKPALHDYCK